MIGECVHRRGSECWRDCEGGRDCVDGRDCEGGRCSVGLWNCDECDCWRDGRESDSSDES